MSRFIFIDGHQIDAIKSAISSIEESLKRKQKRYEERVKEYESLMRRKAEAVKRTGNEYESGPWANQSRPSVPGNSEAVAELERLRAIVIDFEAQR